MENGEGNKEVEDVEQGSGLMKNDEKCAEGEDDATKIDSNDDGLPKPTDSTRHKKFLGKFHRVSQKTVKTARKSVKRSSEKIKLEAFGSDDDESEDIEGETDDERHSRKINESIQADKVKLVRNLVPPNALGYDQRVHAIVDDHTSREPDADPAQLVAVIEETDAPYLAERVLINILERVREDDEKIANYQRLLWFLAYMFLFVIGVALQQSVFSPDLITTYGAMRDEIFGLSGAAVADDEVADIRDSVASWDGVLDFVRENIIETIFTEEACGNNICQKQDEWPIWEPAPDARQLGGCAVDCGRMVTTQVTVTFFDAWKLRESIKMVDAILEEDEFCWQGECYPLETWSPQTPRAGWNICSATEKPFGINTTVCVFDGDFFIDGLPFRQAELNVNSAFFGASKTVELFAGSWELRYGVDGFTWTHPRTGASTTIAFPAFRGRICTIDPELGTSTDLMCQNFAACPDADTCTCEFVSGEYVCHDTELNTEQYQIPLEVASVGLDAPSYDPIILHEYAGIEAIADWWRVKTFYGDRSFASLITHPPNTGRVAPILDATIKSAEFPVLHPSDDAVETIDPSIDVGFGAGWVNADGNILTIGAREMIGSDGQVTLSRTITAFRFANVNIPNGATILRANIYFTVPSAADQPDTAGESMYLSFRAEDTGNAESFFTTINDNDLQQISTRTYSNAITTSFVPQPKNDGDVAFSPDLRELLQNTVSRTDWSSGNAIVFTIEGLEGTLGGAAIYATKNAQDPPVTWLSVDYIETQSFEYIIDDGKDDVTEETAFSGSVYGFSDMDLGKIEGDSTGLRFTDVSLVRNQKVLRAELSVFGNTANKGIDSVTVENFTQAFSAADGPLVNILIDVAYDNFAFGTDNPGPYQVTCNRGERCNETSVEAYFNIGSYDIATRNFTKTRLVESMPPFNGEGTYAFADISQAIQELIDSDDWNPRDSVLLRLTRARNDTYISNGHKIKATLAERGVEPDDLGKTSASRLFFIVERTLSTGTSVSPFPTIFPTSAPSMIPTLSPQSLPSSAPTGCNDRLQGNLYANSIVNPRGTALFQNLDSEIPIDGLCVAILAISEKACHTEFCPTCKFQGLCDRTCGFCFSNIPTSFPTNFPTKIPSIIPSKFPTKIPTNFPTSPFPSRPPTLSIARITPTVNAFDRRFLEDTQVCTTAQVTASSSQFVQVQLYESESGNFVINTIFSSSTNVDICLEVGMCYELVIGETTLPKGFRFQLGSNILATSPFGPSYIRALESGDIFEYESCDASASRIDRIIQVETPRATDSTGPQLDDKNNEKMFCYKNIIGTEPRLPTTHYSACTAGNPTLYPYANFEECPEDETHCFYIEVSGTNRNLDNDLCYSYHRIGGCWTSFEEIWNLAFGGNASQVPQRGSLDQETCEKLQAVIFGTDANVLDCVGCQGNLCDRQDPNWYDNVFGVSGFTLKDSADQILSTEELLSLNSEAVVCDSVATTDTNCDEIYNHLGCNFDNGACCRSNEFDESICEPWAPWMMTANETWRYARIINDNVFATVPLALLRASIDALALQQAINDDLISGKNNFSTSSFISQDSFGGATTPIRELKGIDSLLLNLPSLACPECSAANDAYSTYTFDVNVTFENALGYFDWSPKIHPDKDCHWIDDTCIPANGETYCCALISEDNILASDVCRACGATIPKEQAYYTRFSNDEPRARYLSNPNLVVYGPILQQTSRSKSDGCYTNRPYNSKLKYLDDQIGDGSDPDPGFCNAGETEESFGVDATYLDTSETYNEANNDIVLDLYSSDDLVGGVPRGFFYKMGRKSTGEHYPIYWDVNLNRSQALKIVTLLEDGNYFDDFTQEATISIITTNRKAESRLIAFFELEASVMPTGGIQFQYQIQTIDTNIPIYNLRYWHRNSNKNKAQILVEALFIILLISLVGLEVAEMYDSMRRLHIGPGLKEYFTSSSNWLDLTSYILVIVMIQQRFSYIRQYHRVIDNLQVHYDVHVNDGDLRLGRILEYNENMNDLQDAFHKVKKLSFFQIVYKVLITCAIMVMVLMLLKAFHFHPHMGIITRTVSKAGYSLAFWFGLQFFISLLYALLAVILFSQSSEGFGSDDVSGLLESQFGFSLLAASGMYDPNELQEIPGFNLFVQGLSFYVTQAFFWSYLFISFFIMFNALLAIIVGAYDEVSDQMRRANADPLPFYFKRLFGYADVPGGALSLKQLLICLEAWVGQKIDMKVSKKDGLEDIIAKLRAPPKNPVRDAHTVFKSKVLRLPKQSKFFRFTASPQDPVIAMEINFLSLIARVYSEYYLSFVHPNKLTYKNIFGRTKQFHPLDIKGGINFAANILARYGTSADLDQSGQVDKDEAIAIRKLVILLPQIVDEHRTPKDRLAAAFRHFYNIVQNPMTPNPTPLGPQSNADIVLGNYTTIPAGARRNRRKHRLRRRKANETQNEDEGVNELLVSQRDAGAPGCCSDYVGDRSTEIHPQTQSLAAALSTQRAELLRAQQEGRLDD
mmetsp:Transcript_21808/g.33530  ORF Transcript_21808/g.33530 Transcript_21808/m.33530 type:complete len:2490 (-) Transcript_21808:215-7684(-)